MSRNFPKTAMVLAAGKGTRMRPLSLKTPKPLIDVAGRALMDRVIDPLISAGVERLVVNVHWLADQIEEHLAQRTDNVDYVISDERDTLLETGGGLAKARPFLGDAPIFVVNTDAFWGRQDISPLMKLADFFDPELMDIALLLAKKNRSLGYPGAGDFFADAAGVLTRRGQAEVTPFAFSGVRIINPKLYDGIPIRPFSANQIWDPLLAAGRLRGCILDDFWLHVGDPRALADAQIWLRCHGQ